VNKKTKIFIDVGAHIGESLEEGLRDVYKFDAIHCIEPSKFGNQKLTKYKDKRIILHKIGVADYNGTAKLYGSGAVGASLFEDKKQLWNKTEEVAVTKFSDWLNKNIPEASSCFIKINIEGSEIAILREILQSIKKEYIKSILLSIDVYKVPSLKKYHKEFEDILRDYPINIQIRNEKEIDVAIRNWLKSQMPEDRLNSFKDVLKDFIRPELPLLRNIRRVVKPVFPRKFWIYFALKLGPNRSRS
jgi:FkbM family methyltransferase